MRHLAFALLVAGCGDDTTMTGPVDHLTFAPPGCSYTVANPDETSLALADDGGAPGTPRALHLGFVADPSTTAVVTWATDVGATGTKLQFGPSGGALADAHGFSYAYATDLAGSDPPSVRIHQVHLCGLAPGTAYTVSVAGQGAQFATAPQGGASLRIAVAGDSRGNAADWGKVLDGAAAAGPELLLYTGDAVDLGSIQTAWDGWFDAGKTALARLPIVFAQGNHEINARHFYAQFPMPKNQTWYDFDWGDVHFVVLDTTPRVDSAIEGDEATFLDHSLASTAKPWKVVIHHKGPYSSSTHGQAGEGTRFQQAWVPIYDKYHVDAVFNGHDHDYERTKSMKGGAPVADGAGTTYVVNGGGGADPYPSGTSAFTAFSQTTLGYNLVDLAGAKMTITAFAVGAGAPTQIDQVVLSR